MAANQSAARSYSRTSQAALDRDTEISRKQFDDRSGRLSEASATNLARARAGYDERNQTQRDTERSLSDLMISTSNARRGIENDIQLEQGKAAAGYNAETAAARERQAGYGAEGRAAVDNMVGGFDFASRAGEREALAAARDAGTQAAISDQPVDTGGVSGAIARAVKEAVAAKVADQRDLGTRGAKVASYGDLLRTGDERIDTGGEAIADISRRSGYDLAGLDARLKPFARRYDSVVDLGQARLSDILEMNKSEADFLTERGNRVIQSSADNETTLASILDQYTGGMNAASSNYEEALRRNAQIRLNGTSRTSPIGQLFTTLGGAVGNYAAAGRGPTWSQVGSVFSGTPKRGISGYQTTVY